MSKNYLSDEGFITVTNATKAIVEKYDIVDRSFEGKIYRTILEMANDGKFNARKYKQSTRIWEISIEIIPAIEKLFNLNDICVKQKGFIQESSSINSDYDKLNLIKTLINSCLNKVVTKEQCFDIIASLLIENIDNK